MAARLCDIAERYEVLIPTMGLERLPEGVVATPHGPVELAGFPGPIEVLRADRRAQGARPQRHRRALDPLAVHLTVIVNGRSGRSTKRQLRLR